MKKVDFIGLLNYFAKSVMAGIMISVGCTVFLMTSNKIVGSFLFAIGLLTILLFDFNLYTGKIGYIFESKNPLQILVMIIGNFAGTFLTGVLMRQTRLDFVTKAADLSALKLSDNVWSILILAFFCGMMMFLAVDIYKNAKDPVVKYLGVFLGVSVFILCGFEHSIANMCYFTMAWVWSGKAVGYIWLMILGNALGAIFLNCAKKLALPKKDKTIIDQ